MTVRLKLAALALASVLGLALQSQAGEWDVAGQGSIDLRYFPSNVAFPNQKNIKLSPSVVLYPKLVYAWNGGDDRFTFMPFIRFDGHDKRRTHADIREANWIHLGSNWDVAVGFAKVFWGVTESVHLVDIINQIDAVEDVSGEDKLGQPMINFTIEEAWGVFNLIALPGFRPRTFTADNARLHGPLSVDAYNATYESRKGTRHIDWAVRWSHTFGDVDVAVSHFQGTSREPILRLQNRAGLLIGVPHYNQIGQTGLELQLTTDNTLWKAEGFSRSGHGKRFYAAAGGFEHTLYGVADSPMDVGILLEYLSDNRDPRFAPASAAQNDIFAGLRFVLNDTQDTSALLGASMDIQSQATSVILEAGRRLNDHLKATINGRFFIHIPSSDPLALIRSDDYIELTLDWFF